MSQKIMWNEPTQTFITKVEISTCGIKYGNYIVATTINATDNGSAKSSANNWSTAYTDPTGLRTTWYKIRFSNGTYYSDYSDPITNLKEASLCSVDDVKGIIDTVGRWTDSEIFDAILIIEKDMYDEMGTPIKLSISDIGYNTTLGTTYKTYYVGEEDVYRIDRVFVGTTTKYEIFEDDEYKTNLKYGMIKLLPYASSGFRLTRDSRIEMRYVPITYNRIATYRTAKFLLEQLDMISRGSMSKELTVINNRLEMAERNLQNKIGVLLSSDFKNYNPIYGVNSRVIRQDFDRNTYLSTYGW